MMPDELDALSRFPVPPFGLSCPVCKHRLDGLANDLCPECGERFELRELIAKSLPHSLQARREAIRILTSEVAPDCASEADLVVFFAASDQYTLREAVEALVRVAHERQEGRRAAGEDDEQSGDLKAQALTAPPGVPFFTGYELPVPNFGLHCRECNYPLRGLPRRVCPECGTPFNPAALLGSEPSLQVCPVNSEVEYAHVKSLLDARSIPHVLETTDVLADTLRMRVGAQRKIGRVTVPREFYFDALFWLRRVSEGESSAHSEDAQTDQANEGTDRDWQCPNCHESVPAGFDMCWNCCTMRP